MSIENLSEQECISAIKEGRMFHASVADGAFTIKIESDAPFICTAIHNGHRVRDEIIDNCALSDDERYFEEDPHTDEFINNMPITVIGCDSRYEYDLNRSPDTAIYEEAWGKAVWKAPLSTKQMITSLDKHYSFYRVIFALYDRVIEQHGGCLVYDIHSYNYKRKGDDSPAFNLGTEQLDVTKYGDVINHWIEQLNNIEIPNHSIRAALDEVFYGRGYQATIAKNFDNTLVLPTEFKKFFMDEMTGRVDQDVIETIKPKFEQAILDNVEKFSDLFLSQNK